MNTLQQFFFNSLTVTTGLVFYSLFIYFIYLVFMKEEDNQVENNKVEENPEKEKIDNFDVLEDSED